mmetsp:Transcript_87356/g.137910  ORF Transcript_87356/g.137910 Transcript_87356/m.137910 type:complete len:215 (+) Transcript_87356:521-1165(+)
MVARTIGKLRTLGGQHGVRRATFASLVERTCVELLSSRLIQLESKPLPLAQAQDLHHRLHQRRQLHHHHQALLPHITRIQRMAVSLTKLTLRSKASLAVFAHLLAASSSDALQMSQKVSQPTHSVLCKTPPRTRNIALLSAHRARMVTSVERTHLARAYRWVLVCAPTMTARSILFLSSWSLILRNVTRPLWFEHMPQPLLFLGVSRSSRIAHD